MKKIYFVTLLFYCLFGCREVLEKDIGNTEVELISPPDQFRSEVLNQTFYWKKLDGASSYRIQIVTPSFAPDSMIVIVDSVTKKTHLTKSLPFGKKFQWRVLAINGGYDSRFTLPRNLFIDSSANLSIQIVERVSPLKNIYLNKDKLLVPFSWTSLPQAQGYYFTIDSSGTDVYGPIKVNGNTSSFKFKNESQYSWNIVGYNQTSYSNKSQEKFFVNVDLTLPKCTLTSPADNISVRDSSVNLLWTSSDLPIYSGIKGHYLFVYDSTNSRAYLDYNGKLNLGNSEKLSLPKIKSILAWYVIAEDFAGNKYATPTRKILVDK
ncbi:MAG: hypothetical protein H7329_00605 [Opitutaceae bacterium]|nr:hypothetical protein [Cytophagales bacterium]